MSSYYLYKEIPEGSTGDDGEIDYGEEDSRAVLGDDGGADTRIFCSVACAEAEGFREDELEEIQLKKGTEAPEDCYYCSASIVGFEE